MLRSHSQVSACSEVIRFDGSRQSIESSKSRAGLGILQKQICQLSKDEDRKSKTPKVHQNLPCKLFSHAARISNFGSEGRPVRQMDHLKYGLTKHKGKGKGQSRGEKEHTYRRPISGSRCSTVLGDGFKLKHLRVGLEYWLSTEKLAENATRSGRVVRIRFACARYAESVLTTYPQLQTSTAGP